MKKLVLVLPVIMLAGGLFFACGSRQGAAGTITFHFWDENQRPGMEAVVAAYTRETGIRVETTLTPFTQYWTRMQTALPTDGGPDVFWLNYTNAVDYIPAGLVQEISTFIQRDNVDMSVFPRTLIEMYSHNGKEYGIPKDFDTIALFYNKAIFDARGVPYPTDDWTWADLRSAAERLTYGNVHGFIASFEAQGFLHSWILSNNGSLISEDRSVMRWNTPETIEAVREALRFQQDGLSPTGSDISELGSLPRFQGGLAAMFTSGSWNVPPIYDALGQNLGVARFPYSIKPANIIHGLSFSISARSRVQEEAWGLLKAFTTIEAGEAQAKVVIPAYEGAAEAWTQNFPSLNLQVFIDAAAYADPLPVPTRAAQIQTNIIVTQLENITIGGMDAAEALANIDREVEAAAGR